MPALNPRATIQVHVSLLLQIVRQQLPIAGIAVTPLTHEVVLACAPSYFPATLHSGSMLSSSQLKCLVEEQVCKA
ncbi:hypothetical protein HaLaN_14714 [Haematococcus lacustris]|uniref:Uncharacterized protein n=1 Tax=Haematococcus lacustris TaxID=44745 RepID=A0A699ZGG4_HAELA|nr:hypothetical protein HaLaN_14714 [Haematococcus lacustris]